MKLSEDIDNFSGTNSRGDRYDILADGEVIYHDIPESAVDHLCDELARKPYYTEIEAKLIS